MFLLLLLTLLLNTVYIDSRNERYIIQTMELKMTENMNSFYLTTGFLEQTKISLEWCNMFQYFYWNVTLCSSIFIGTQHVVKYI